MSRAWQGWALGLAAVVWGAAVWAVPVNDIRIVPRGPVPISAEQVRGQISARVGQELDRGALSEDLRALQKSSVYSFAEVRLEQAADGGVILTFHVQGRPVIRTLTVSGADYIGNKKVRNLMEIGSGDRADDAVLGEKSQKVREHYRKEYFPDAKVTWTFHPVAGHPDMTDVDIQVTEGRRAVVRKIRFTGNRHIPARELRKVMAQKQSTWLSWMTSAGMYDPGVLVADREVLRKVFMDKGYLGATVGEPQIAYVNRKKIDITFPVHEGPVYTLAAWRIEGMQSFAERDVVRGVVVNTGAVATLEGLTRGAQNIRDYYGSRGYIKTLVDPRITLDTNRAAAAVMYHVQEGPLAYIQNIEIRGNAQTQDKVIRREIGVAPGEVYNDVKIRASENRLRNLNYFSFVNSYPEDTVVSNRFNLVFDLEEQRTGQFMVGAGFSSIDNVLGYVELTQGNFDLFGWPRFTGGGQRLRLRAQIGDSRSDLELSLIEPWFLNRRLSLGLDLFRRDARYLSDDYDQISTGGSLTLGKPLYTIFHRVNWIYGLENIDIRNVETNASDLIKAEGGGRLKSYGTMELIRDTRNNTFVATRGFRGSVSATLAGGPFGADEDTYQFQLRASQYIPLWFDHVLNLRGWTSVIHEYGDSERVPIFDRLFAGGPRTVRAFRYRKVGPKDQNNEALGGRSVATATAEYTLPVVDKIRFAVFYDAGIVWQGVYEKDNDPDSVAVGDGIFCDGYGLGVRFDFPGFPIQLDYAWPINTDDYQSDSGRFSFTIGYSY
ncbi:MAG TPA: outer membrane protein assembly factor BamA [Kiritimatiellia bacterium]|jgi:outer membrane protein insertion porin family|nr:outer membrane protein assembly factor BamA [Kiritimatiellia bacterium]HOR74867.1 outer membrane protein assembly factor BamA [Kiritimatiellia bacterium]HOU59523.1 outer membrane protein assembly factor BamA [Kiritimatiellia bacterium]HPK69819.1 outer membrane protein assembly factor BamA [Kiritimatiellia bacterium]HQF20947.1 outer membrane protein assembly factor BamA [Kiritimatiellia bacterium]